jgi:hypothetical protein
MNKKNWLGLLLIFPAGLLAEANIEAVDMEKSYLLTAPGTISGKIVEQSSHTQGASNSDEFVPETNPPRRYDFPHYNFIQDPQLRFPQYGQMRGRQNPWSEKESRRQRPPPLPTFLPPASKNSVTNPWDLTGGRINEYDSYPRYPDSGYPSYRNPYNTSLPMSGFGSMYHPKDMSDYTDGIFRDTNPAARGPFNGFMPGLDMGNNHFMPGMENDDTNLPFSPFGMF